MANKSIGIKFGLAAILATYCNIGNVRYAPGTFGSLATFPLFLLLNYVFLKFGIATFFQLSIAYVSTLFILLCLAFWSVNTYIGLNKKDDPSEVVIDEVVGQMIAYMMPTLLTVYYFVAIVGDVMLNTFLSILISFILIITPVVFFRLFDIVKPGLVGYFDKKVPGAFGVIMDDVVAGVYSGFIVCLILMLMFLIIGHFY